jgi:hypothetical protein
LEDLTVVNKYIYLNYYSDKNIIRKKEIIFCINKNLNLNFVKKIFIFVEKNEEILDLNFLPNFKKITFIITNKKRVLTSELFEHANQNLKKNCVAIFISSDIFLHDSLDWKDIDKSFFRRGYPYKVLLSIRKNLFSKLLSIRQLKWEKLSAAQGEFCDCVAMKTPFKKSFMRENLKFIWGIPCGDSLLMGLLNKHYHVFSWGKKYQSFHYDVVNKKKENPFLTFNHIEIKRNFEIGALLRIDEAARVCMNQNWNFLLTNRIKPQVIYLKNSSDDKIKKFFRKTYYYFILNLIKFFARIVN